MSKYNDYIYKWNSKKKKHTYEHRDVVENEIGRSLSSDEIVHHIDGNKKNNVISNLTIKNISNHTSEHLKGTSRGVCDICGEKQHAKKLCKKHYQQMLRSVQK